MHKVITVIGARPQFIKAAMLSRTLAASKDVQEIIVHTGQHYDENMSKLFFDQMRIPKPKYNLEVGSGTHGKQTGAMIAKLEEVYEKEKPDATIVFGDTNSTLAGAVCSAKLGIPVIHVEAGMRSYNKYQAEENNRVLTDHCAELLLCSSKDSLNNLAKEGITKNVFVTGDIMLDSTIAFSTLPTDILQRVGVKSKQYILVTCHRAESTDDPVHLSAIVEALIETQSTIVFPVHPRTLKYLQQHGLLARIQAAKHIKMIEPVSYVDSLHLQHNASKVVTDSGGIQKEAYFLSVPCITLRDTTEWTELVEIGWNITVGYNKQAITYAIINFHPPQNRPALFGDGRAAEKIRDHIILFLKELKN